MKAPEPIKDPCYLCGELGWHTITYEVDGKKDQLICWDCYKDRKRDGELP